VATDRDPRLLDLVKPLVTDAVGSDELQLPAADGTADSFASNAALRARNASRIVGVAALASDSGLVLEALGGAPGAWHARDDLPLSRLVSRLYTALATSDAPDDRRASRVYAVALAWPDGYSEAFEARIEGTILPAPPEGPVRSWDDIFVPQGHDRPLASLPDAERRQLDPGVRAVQRLGDAWIRGAA